MITTQKNICTREKRSRHEKKKCRRERKDVGARGKDVGVRGKDLGARKASAGGTYMSSYGATKLRNKEHSTELQSVTKNWRDEAMVGVTAVAGTEDGGLQGCTVRRRNSFVGGTAERKTRRGVDVGSNGGRKELLAGFIFVLAMGAEKRKGQDTCTGLAETAAIGLSGKETRYRLVIG